jgi:RNA polymerase sigma factor (sigma-70 family)
MMIIVIGPPSFVSFDVGKPGRLHAGPGISILRTDMSSDTSEHALSAAVVPDPDGVIIERIRNGEVRLYEVLIRRHNQRLYRVARAFLGDSGEIEDVMQDTYLKAYAALSNFQGRSLFSTWLTRVLINCALVRLRASSRHAEIPLDAVDERAAYPGHTAPPEMSGEQKVLREQIGRLIEKAIDTLPPKYRVVFVMRELEKASVAETAAGLGITPANVKVRFHRARRLLQESLRREMPDVSVHEFFGARCDGLTVRVMAALVDSPSGQPDDGSGRAVPGLAHPEVVDELRSVMRP